MRVKAGGGGANVSWMLVFLRCGVGWVLAGGFGGSIEFPGFRV